MVWLLIYLLVNLFLWSICLVVAPEEAAKYELSPSDVFFMTILAMFVCGPILLVSLIRESLRR